MYHQLRAKKREELMKRKEAIDAVRSGAAITVTAARFGISRVTLYRWLRAFDPDHPIASARPRKKRAEGSAVERQGSHCHRHHNQGPP
jgi:transposase-like protein